MLLLQPRQHVVRSQPRHLGCCSKAHVRAFGAVAVCCCSHKGRQCSAYSILLLTCTSWYVVAEDCLRQPRPCRNATFLHSLAWSLRHQVLSLSSRSANHVRFVSWCRFEGLEGFGVGFIRSSWLGQGQSACCLEISSLKNK